MLLNKNDFYKEFSSVGSLIITGDSKSTYTDLEMLFVNFLDHVFNDDRTYRAITFWLRRYGKFLSPKKLKKLLKKKVYDPRVLNALLKVSDSNFPKNEFKSLYSEGEAISSSNGFKLPKRVPRSQEFLEFGLEAPLVEDDPNEELHSLRTTKWVYENVPEIRNRVMGLTKSVADYRALLEKEKDIKSIYKASKKIYLCYARAHEVFHKHILPLKKDGLM